MNEIEILNEGIPHVRHEISGNSKNFCFELTFNKNSNIKLLSEQRLVIVDSEYKEIKNNITFDKNTFKAKFVSLHPYKPNTDYFIVLINTRNVIVKKIICFQINGDNKISFKKIEEKANIHAAKNSHMPPAKAHDNPHSGTTDLHTVKSSHVSPGIAPDYFFSGAATRIIGATMHEGKLYVYKDKLLFHKNGSSGANDDLHIPAISLKAVEWHVILNAMVIINKGDHSYLFRVKDRKEWIHNISNLINT